MTETLSRPPQTPEANETDASDELQYHQEELFPVEEVMPQEDEPEEQEKKKPDPLGEMELNADERAFARTLASRLDNPELSGTQKLRARVHDTGIRAVNKIEEKTDTPTKAVSYAMHKRREVMYKYAKGKHDKFERKSKESKTAWGRKRNLIKMQRQKFEMDARENNLNASQRHYDGRKERRKNAKELRAEGYMARVERYMEKQRAAQRNKTVRNAKRLEKLADLPLVDPDVRDQLQRKLKITGILLDQRK